MILIAYVCPSDSLPTIEEQIEQINAYCDDHSHSVQTIFEEDKSNAMEQLSAALSATDDAEGLIVYDFPSSILRIKKDTDIIASLARFVRKANPKTILSVISDATDITAIYQAANQRAQEAISKSAD